MAFTMRDARWRFALRGKLISAGRHARNVLIDLRYGARLGGRAKPQQYADFGAYHANNSDYGLLAQMFRGRVQADDVLVDVGSGRGRVLNYWLHAGHRGPIYGLEIDPEYAAASARRLARWPNVTVRQGDAIDNLPPSATLLFLFNPFDRVVMRRLQDAIPQRIQHVHRLRILYYAPTCIDVWTNDPRWNVDVHELDLRGIERFADRHRNYAVITPSPSSWTCCARDRE